MARQQFSTKAREAESRSDAADFVLDVSLYCLPLSWRAASCFTVTQVKDTHLLWIHTEENNAATGFQTGITGFQCDDK